MGLFYVMQGDYLVSHGYAQDGCEQMQVGKGQSVVLGAVPGFGEVVMPLAGGSGIWLSRGGWVFGLWSG